ncbi:hypothetical protein CC86DRAFT_382501 [Ophiobolus disseminans]|uniref:CRT10-domain-containing protein n=1 Tax=Ophiobolus disseminans TaxID=1469910 RepID=A0A6A7A019_9PLEO|nr:hypothetical protein CC86DRAFT_382501 [Ophiobolus disseminans]
MSLSHHVVCEGRAVTRGLDRVPRPHEAPLVKEWRCELTALSQKYNIYFVGCTDVVNVYQPSFPNQAISGDPILVLHPPTSRRPQPGSLHNGNDPDDPHSINRLHVDYLGDDEILLMTCDDGDVVAYRMEEIQTALGRLADNSSQEPLANEIRTFLHRNVGASAWGIAVHRNARMIAFSANTYQVTIIAFALTTRRDGSPEPEFSDPLPALKDNEETIDFSLRREREHMFTVAANTNIPSIAFDNTGKDPIGRWLLSSSIDGKTMLFDLHKQRLSSVFQMGWCRSTKHPGQSPLSDSSRCRCGDWFHVSHAIWGAMFLDVLSAHEASPRDVLDLECQTKAPFFQDATKQNQHFALRAEYNPNEDAAQSRPGTPLDITDGTDDSCSDPEDSDEEASEGSVSIEYKEEDEDSDAGHSQDNHHAGGYPAANLAPHVIPTGFYEQTRIQPRQPYCEITNIANSKEGDNHLPYLVITTDDLFLVQRPPLSEPKYPPDPTYPYLVTTMRYPLRPRAEFSGIETYGRQCFFKQIPELGMFIIASSLGRAAIFSLTRRRRAPGDEESTYGFQMEYMLPFIPGRENDIWCPALSGAKLAGIAVSPIQGMLDKPVGTPSEEVGYDARAYGEGRWRLMMYYTDHTVVSYEIMRKKKDGQLGLGDIVV